MYYLLIAITPKSLYDLNDLNLNQLSPHALAFMDKLEGNMWKQVDDAFFGPKLDDINKKMNEIAKKLLTATFSSSKFAAEMETFVKNQLKTVAASTPIENLTKFGDNVKGLYTGFKDGAAVLMDGSKTVSKDEGVRKLLPVVMDLGKRLLEHPVLKAADEEINVLAVAMRSLKAETTQLTVYARNLEEINDLIEANSEQESIAALMQSGVGDVATAPIDAVGLYISIFSELKPYLERVHKYVFKSIRSSSFATSIMKDTEGGLDLAVEFCKHSETVNTFHSQINELHDAVHGNTVLNDAQHYVSFFTGNVIFNYLGQFDDLVTSGCATVTGITDKHDTIKQDFTKINNLVQAASSYGKDMNEKLLEMTPSDQSDFTSEGRRKKVVSFSSTLIII